MIFNTQVMAAREHINDYFNGRPFMTLCALALVAIVVVLRKRSNRFDDEV